MRAKPYSTPPSRENAELIGLQALGWMAGRPHFARKLFDSAGTSAAEMRTRAADPEFLGFVLEFLLGDEEELLAFARDAGVSPDSLHHARAVLLGGELPHWT